jgi:hypothetical protein
MKNKTLISSLPNFDLIKLLGEGSYGKAFLAQDKTTKVHPIPLTLP